MATNVTQLVNEAIQNNPNANASVKAGAATASALFTAAETGNFNVSTLINALPAGTQANVKAATASTANVAKTGGNGTSQTTSVSSNLGPDDAKKASFTQGANRLLLQQPDVPTGAPTLQVKPKIPTLLSTDVRALMIQIAYMESEWNTKYTNPPWIGRYAVHEKTLKSYGYLSNTGTYLGKDGINSRVDFWYDSVVQDRIMERFIQDQYKALIKSGGIKENDTKETVAGMIAVAYQFQDANVTLSSIGSVLGGVSSLDPSGLLESAGKLASGMTDSLADVGTALGKSLTIGSSNSILSAASSDPATNANLKAVQSNIQIASSVLSAFTGSDLSAASAFTGVLALAEAAIAANKAKSNLSPTTSNTTAATSAQAGLPASLTAAKDQAKLTAAKIDVAGIKAKADDLAVSLPASKATQWRKTGKEKDSRGRPGALFFNAGRYAVSTLNADISVAPSKPVTVTI